MARFTKYNNPSKKRKARRKLSLSERIEREARASLIDARLGYAVPTEFYQARIDKQ